MGIPTYLRPEELGDSHANDKLDDWDRYIKALESDQLPRTPVEQNICSDLLIPITGDPGDLLSATVRSNAQRIIVDDEELRGFNINFVNAFNPATPMVIVPLRTPGAELQEDVMGVVVADNMVTKYRPSHLDVESLLTLANIAAICNPSSLPSQAAKSFSRTADTCERCCCKNS